MAQLSWSSSVQCPAVSRCNMHLYTHILPFDCTYGQPMLTGQEQASQPSRDGRSMSGLSHPLEAYVCLGSLQQSLRTTPPWSGARRGRIEAVCAALIGVSRSERPLLPPGCCFNVPVCIISPPHPSLHPSLQLRFGTARTHRPVW